MEVEKSLKHWAFRHFLKLETVVNASLSRYFKGFFLKLIFKSLIEHWSFMSMDYLLSTQFRSRCIQYALNDQNLFGLNIMKGSSK